MRYVVLVDYTDMEARALVLDRHRAYIEAGRSRGVVTESGPFEDGKGGMYILKTPNEAAARDFVANDPYQEAKLRITLRPWKSNAV
jgi:uncharacterized protein YciI